MIDLDLMRFKEFLVFKKTGTATFVRDPIRKIFVLLQPEELVRQLFVVFLLKESSFHRNLIQVEKSIILNGMNRRFDLVVYNKNQKPYIIVECKAPEIKLTQESFDQVARYNMVLEASYTVVTNGISCYCAKTDHENHTYVFLKQIPQDFI